MLAYIIRRTLFVIPVVFGVALVVFVLFNVVGWNAASQMLGRHASAEEIAALQKQLGLTGPKWLNLEEGRDVWKSWPEVTPDGPLLFNPGYMVGRYVLAKAAGKPVLFNFRGAKESRWIDVFDSRVFHAVRGFFDARVFNTLGGFLNSQFFRYLKQIVTLDFGRSFASNQKISTLILNGMLPSLSLAVPIFICETVVAIAIALVAAYYRNTWLDRGIVVVSVIGLSVSYLVYIMVAQQILAYQWKLFPIWGYESVRNLMLPVIVGVMSGLGGEVRFYRTVMLDEMYQDYVRTAFSKGCSQKSVLFRHVLKNAMIPVITSTVLAIPFLYTGNLLLETFFGIPGLGYLSVEAINSTDYPVIKATVFVGSIMFVIATLITDICYALVDPRIKLR